MSGTTLPTVMTAQGLQPQAPASILAQLLAAVAATNPGYTANLPGALIEDVSSTDVAAIVLCDQARVEVINSITPLGANEFLLTQLGQIYGVSPSLVSTTSVFVVFTTSPSAPGFVLAKGFTISDGTHSYILQDGGIVGSDGTTLPLSAIATQAGSWDVPANTVTQLVTSVPSTVTLTVTNPLAGTPAGLPETAELFRSRCLQAGLAASQGMARYLKTFLANTPGVQARLIAVKQIGGGGWEVICGGSADPYQIAYAIYSALFDVSTLIGSTLVVAGITKANPGVVTTTLNHGYTTGQIVEINGALGMTAVNATPFTITVLTEKTFSIGVDTTGYGTYTGGGVLTPNFRNVAVSINDYPDTYVIPYVNPPAQTVTMTVTWNTSSTNFVSSAAVAQLGGPALAAYVNAIPDGAPMNLFELQETFQVAIASVLSPVLLTRMVFSVSINGVGTPPASGTGVIAGDPESFFTTTSAAITITQG